MGITMRALLLLTALTGGLAVSVYSPRQDYTESNCYDQKQAIVHLFEWHWDWIADECEKVLGPKGFCEAPLLPRGDRHGRRGHLRQRVPGRGQGDRVQVR